MCSDKIPKTEFERHVMECCAADDRRNSNPLPAEPEMGNLAVLVRQGYTMGEIFIEYSVFRQ